ncbi:cytochrome P450 [Streptomyces sp. ST1015]|uniref:cytochrome P450 n=1 Tax=unclassified Streptomyces TaxID=2593676 RepID=UPI001CA74F6B|nr:cytochrome P450 [Streptomyces sp. ST1015]QZZ25376.1 cytochrome P450 [Streptomyces sp. ST1015]
MPLAPLAPGAVPLAGHTLALLRDPADWLRRCTDAGHPVQRVRLWGRPSVLVTDPELAHTVLVTRTDAYDKVGRLHDNTRALLGDILGVAPGERNALLRRRIQPSFRRARVADAVPAMSAEARRLAGQWRSGSVVDAMEAVGPYVHRSAVRTLLPVVPAAEVDRLAAASDRLFSALYLYALLPGAAAPLLARRIRPALETLRRAEVLALRAPERTGLLAALDDASQDEVRDYFVSLLMAGGESTHSTVAWLLHHLARDQELQRRLADEVAAVAPDGPATHADLAAMPLLQRAVVETLRVRPATWMLVRTAVTATELGGCRIPAGTDVYLSPHQYHHDPGAFPDPDAFAPERWPHSGPAARDHTYLPFGAGPRKCPGDHFGMTSVAVVTATLLAHWRLLPAGRPPRARFRVVQTPVGCRLAVLARRPRPPR